MGTAVTARVGALISLRTAMLLVAATGLLAVVSISAERLFPWTAAGVLVAAAAAIAWIDAKTLTIADRHTVALGAGAVLLAGVASLQRATPAPLIEAILAAVVAAGVYLALGLAGAVGFGDVKLAIALTAATTLIIGPAAAILPVPAIAIACVSQAWRLLRRHAERHSAHAPKLALATVIVIVAHSLLISR